MAVKVHTGELTKKVVFKQPTVTRNTEGGKEITWADAMETFAKVSEISQSRINEATAPVLLHSKDFYIRWASSRDAINKDWLLNYKGQDYTIHQIEHLDEKEKYIRFTAKVKGNG
jgi:SPP1 family predicted phage head-tail adaptor